VTSFPVKPQTDKLLEMSRQGRIICFRSHYNILNVGYRASYLVHGM